jgi:hypothetical protein
MLAPVLLSQGLGPSLGNPAWQFRSRSGRALYCNFGAERLSDPRLVLRLLRERNMLKIIVAVSVIALLMGALFVIAVIGMLEDPGED